MGANYCSEDYLHTVNAVRATAFVLSFLACLVVFVTWIIFSCRNCNWAECPKPSLFYTAERLPFYVLVIATMHSFISVFQLASLGHDKSNSLIKFCTAVAFFTTWAETSMLLINIIAPAHLMLINCKRSSDFLQDLKKRRPLAPEAGYIVTVTVVTVTATYYSGVTMLWRSLAWYTLFAQAPDFTIIREFGFFCKFSVTFIVIASKIAECCSSTASFSDAIAYVLVQLSLSDITVKDAQQSEQFMKDGTCSFVYRRATGNTCAIKPFPL